MQLRARITGNPEEAVLRTLHRSVASNLYVSGVSEHKVGKEYHVGACVTEILDDAREAHRTVRYIRLDNVATYRCRTSRRTMTIEGPPRRLVSQRAESSYRRIVQKSQDLLLPSLYERLVGITDVALAMSPLRTILELVNRDNQVRPNQFITPRKSAAKVQNYFTILADLKIIQTEDGHYVPGPAMRRVPLDEPDARLYARILGSVLEQRFDYVREVLKWTMMVPFLEWSNAYYFPAYQASSLLRWTDNDWHGYYDGLYGRTKSDAEIVSQTSKLREAGIIVRDNRFWTGDEEIFDEFSKQSDRQQLLPSA